MKEIEKKIIEVLQKVLQSKKKDIITPSTKLISSGLMESIELLDFLLSLESHGIDLDLDRSLDIDTVSDIIKYVK